MAAFAIAFDAFDLALDPHDACTLCNLAQIRGIKRGVEMKGMGDAVEARVRDLQQPREAVRERSEECREGQECVSTCRSSWSPNQSKIIQSLSTSDYVTHVNIHDILLLVIITTILSLN